MINRGFSFPPLFSGLIPVPEGPCDFTPRTGAQCMWQLDAHAVFPPGACVTWALAFWAEANNIDLATEDSPTKRCISGRFFRCCGNQCSLFTHKKSCGNDMNLPSYPVIFHLKTGDVQSLCGSQGVASNSHD